jgi:hypothetical protein
MPSEMEPSVIHLPRQLTARGPQLNMVLATDDIIMSDDGVVNNRNPHNTVMAFW